MNEHDDSGTVHSVEECTVTVKADDTLGGEEVTADLAAGCDVVVGGDGVVEGLNGEGVSDGLAAEKEMCGGEDGDFKREKDGELEVNASDSSGGIAVGKSEKGIEVTGGIAVGKSEKGIEVTESTEVEGSGVKSSDALDGPEVDGLEKVEAVVNEEGLEKIRVSSKEVEKRDNEEVLEKSRVSSEEVEERDNEEGLEKSSVSGEEFEKRDNEEGLEKSRVSSEEVEKRDVVGTLSSDDHGKKFVEIREEGPSNLDDEALGIPTGANVESCPKVEVVVHREVLEINKESIEEVKETYVVTELTTEVSDSEAQVAVNVTELQDSSTTTVVEISENMEVIVEKEVVEEHSELNKEIDGHNAITALSFALPDAEAEKCAIEPVVGVSSVISNDEVLEASPMTEAESPEKVQVIVKEVDVGRSNELSKESDETQVVEEEITVMDNKAGTEKGLNEDIMEQSTESVHRGSEVLEAGSDAEVLGSSGIPESLTTQTQVVSDEVSLQSEQESLKSKEETLDFPDPELSCSKIDHSPPFVGTSEGAVQANEGNLDQQTEPVGGECDDMNTEEISQSSIEAPDTDVYDGNLHCSDEQRTAKIYSAHDISKSSTILDANSTSFLNTSKPFAGGVIERADDKFSSDPIVEAPADHCSSGVGGTVGEVIIAQSEVTTCCSVVIEDKVLASDSADHGSGEAEALTAGVGAENIDEMENQGGMSGGTKTDVPGSGEQESFNNQTPVANAIEVSTLDNKVPISVAEVPTSGGVDSYPAVSSNFFENMKYERVCATAGEHDIPGIDEGGEDEGMDIDEVLGWKDVEPVIDYSGKDLDSEVEVMVEVDNSVVDNHLELVSLEGNLSLSVVPHHDALEGSSFPSLKDEKVDVETLDRTSVEAVALGQDSSHCAVSLNPDASNLDSITLDENNPVQAVEHVGGEQAETITYDIYQSTDEPIIDEILNEEACTMASLDTVTEVGREYEDATAAVCSHSGANQIADDGQETGNNVQLQGSYSDVIRADELTEVGLVLGKDVEVEEQCGEEQQVHFPVEQETETEVHISEAEQLPGIDEEFSGQNETSVSTRQSCYFPAPETQGEFCVSDLVWGKVRSHPWWPGQIFDPADASEKAMKYHKKDCFLVAYFGDRTFAWNDATVLKPFRTHYAQIAKHSNSEAFQHAVRCALEEVSRRVELGLACSCVPQDFYEKIQFQELENTGVRPESSKRHGADKSADVSSFEPDKLVNYIKAIAQSPYREADKLELAIAKAQLSSYYRYKGYCQLPEFEFCGDLLESPVDASNLSEAVEHTAPAYEDDDHHSNKGELDSESEAPHNRIDNLMDYAHPNIKDKSLCELMDDTACSTDGEDVHDGKTANKSIPTGRKRKALDSVADSSEKRPNLESGKVSNTTSSTPKPSFKVGECIRRVASQLTGSPSILKGSGEKFQKVEGDGDQPSGFDVSVQTTESSPRGRMVVPADSSSPAELLSQLRLAAQDPMKGYGFLNTVIPFFSSYRTAAVSSKSKRLNASNGKPSGARKRKTSNDTLNSPEEFEFDDVNDSYWTDRIIQNYSEEQLLQDTQNGGGEYQVVAFEPDKPVKSGRKSRKRYYSGQDMEAVVEPPEHVDRRKQNLPTEVVLNFTEGASLPSEMYLNKIFRRFGPLMESETEVDRQISRARVVFKKCSDAEVAFSSAGKFEIFGSLHVNYELNYTPLISYKPLPLPALLNQEEAT